jgi:diguanylate cyclase (GGDEF)-like protein
MPRISRIWLFIAAVAIAAAAVVGASLAAELDRIEWSWWGAVCLLIATRAAEAGFVEIWRDSEAAGYGVSIATVPQIACAVLLPAPIGGLLAGTGMLLDQLHARTPLARMTFNVASTTLSVGAAALAASLLGISGRGLVQTGWRGMAAFFVVALVYYAANTVPVACVGALAAGRPIRQGLWQAARDSAPTELAMALLGGLAAFVWVANPWWLLIGISPAIVSQLTLRYIAQRNRTAAELRRMAFHDALTGLPNRAFFSKRLNEVLQRAALSGSTVAVLYLDLDNVRLVNETLGHTIGDGLLKEVAARLMAQTSEAHMTLARLSGDEFTIVVDGLAEPNDALRLAQRLIAALAEPVRVDSHEVVTSASIGVALSGPGRMEPELLLRSADLALYRAKTNGKHTQMLFDASMESETLARMELERELHFAIERGQLTVVYQPIVRMGTDELGGWEALLRWQHPGRGSISPSVFIPIAEDTGLIVSIGQWVLERACQQARQWQQQFPELGALSMSVNLSSRQFAEPHLVEAIENVLRTTGLDPKHLVLEITESVLMQDGAAAVDILKRLHALGIRLAVDDFGTGYSSLAYLKRFPVDTLKIDRSFVIGLGEDAQDDAIVQSIVVLARSLGLTVTAEGIETLLQRERIAQVGCDRGQGYLFGRPASADACEAQLSRLAEARLAPRAA